MDTKPLERFATWARQELLTAVEAQATAVLKADSVARAERAHAVRALEAEINRHGREHVIDKVAYTWFNRIIALRFMDARGYTDTGVVSPAQGQPHGQPEILADAKRGDINTDVITSSRTADAIIGLLDGTRRSTDAEGEAYALLLTAHCRYWHGPMPFMFEREDNYTELLVPANLLADDAILSRALEVLTEDVCDDVEVIGWLYQFYISEKKTEVFAGFKKNKKAGANEIPAATQLFTPHWIVRYLVENSLGRLWMLNHPHSKLVDQMDYYIAPVGESTDFLRISSPEELTVIDPACGSGHMLTYAFDLLYSIYEEEGYTPSEIPGLILANNLYGTEIDQRSGALAAFALTMKARSKQRTFFNKQVKPNICVVEPISFGTDELDFLMTGGENRSEEAKFWNQFAEADTIGSLIQPDASLLDRLARHLSGLDHGGDMLLANTTERANRLLRQARYLTPRYSVLVANPPYMGNRNMSPNLASYLLQELKDYKTDLFAAFIARCLNLVINGAALGFMAPNVWMYISSHEKLRTLLLRNQVETLVELPLNGFRGATVQISAFVFDKRPVQAGVTGTFIGLGGNPGGDAEMADLTRIAIADPSTAWSHRVPLAQFSRIPGSPIAYWLSPRMVEIFQEGLPLSTVAEVKHGLSTGKNAAVVRHWWEVSRCDFGTGFESSSAAWESGKKWFPYNKGGDYRRWYGNFEHVLRYDQHGLDLMDSFSGHRHDGKSHYFREGITWTFISSAYFAARYTPAGSIFDVSGSSLFPSNPKVVLALLCSDLAAEFLRALNPTLNFQVGNIKEIPYFSEGISAIEKDIEAIANRAIDLHAQDWNSYETSWDFDGLSIPDETGRISDLAARNRNFWATISHEVQELENRNNQLFRTAYGVADDENHKPPRQSLSLRRTAYTTESSMRELISFAVGCIFGRYSLDKPGLILADQGATLQDYLTMVPTPTFMPDADNVIPIVDGDWFNDDIVSLFRQFLRAAFGEEHCEANLRFVEESLGVKNLRDYFITKSGKSKFYDDHVQRYKKRPIYWMFSSPKGSFNALIYLHRYTPSTVSTVLNEYLREYRGKLEIALQNAEREAAGGGSSKAQKESDRIRKVLVELEAYEHDVLYPLATQQVAIDLDDGVKVNYPKFGKALKKIKGLEATE